MHLWSQAIGGNLQLKLQDCIHNDNDTPYDWMDDSYSCIASNASPVVIYMENTVSPEDELPSNLVCMESCPDPASLTGPNPWSSSVSS